MDLLILLSAAWCVLLVFASTQLIGARLLRVSVRQVRIGTPQLGTVVRLGETELRLGPIPLFSAVEFSCRPEGPHAVAPEPTERRFYFEIPLWQRALLHLAGVAGVAVLAALLLGVEDAIASVGSGWFQIVEGALSPLETGSELVTRWISAARTDWVGALGRLSAKCTALHLFPLLCLPAGRVPALFVVPPGPDHEPGRVEQTLAVLSLLALTLAAGAWSVAIGAALFF